MPPLPRAGVPSRAAPPGRARMAQRAGIPLTRLSRDNPAWHQSCVSATSRKYPPAPRQSCSPALPFDATRRKSVASGKSPVRQPSRVREARRGKSVASGKSPARQPSRVREARPSPPLILLESITCDATIQPKPSAGHFLYFIYYPAYKSITYVDNVAPCIFPALASGTQMC